MLFGTPMISKQQSDIIQSTLAPFSPEYIGIFGSYARGENKAGSDMDILVKFKSRLTLLDLVGLEMALSEKLGVKVDLVTEGALSKFFRDDVLREVKQIS